MPFTTRSTLSLTGIYIPPVHNHSCLYCKDSPRIGHRIVPHGQHLATLGRKNALLTGRDLQQSQAQGEAVTGLEGERKPKREKKKGEIRDHEQQTGHYTNSGQ